MGNTIIVCGLTEWEKKEIREHKGECKHCMHNESFRTARDTVVKLCLKKGMLKDFETNCKDWVLDTR